MNDRQLKIAQDSLCEWLSQNDVQPKKIELMYSLKDDQNHDRIFGVFRFKKSAHGKYLIGVAGGFPDEESIECNVVFSGFDEFPDNKDEAVELAYMMIDYAMLQNARAMLQDVFRHNMEYISKTQVDVDKIARQFVRSMTRYYLTVGTVDVPSGKVIVADPLCYLSGNHVIAPVLERKIPNGSYPVEVSICRHAAIGIRMCTARLKIKDTKAVRYELAKCEKSTAPFKESDGGFPVDAGMMCFIDAKEAENYAAFIEKWHNENPGKNHYDDYFAAILAESYQKCPEYQRNDGDFTEWTNPETRKRIVMIASGFGDGFYNCFWGFDDSGDICELIVPLVDPDLFDNDK